MRGKRNFVLRIPDRRRITPADAGKTARTRPSRRSARDHPRGCGENGSVPHAIGGSLGSPPRMRGKLDCFDHVINADGITPADAGKTCTDFG